MMRHRTTIALGLMLSPLASLADAPVEVSLRPAAPLTFVAGQASEFLVELVVSGDDGKPRLAEPTRFSDAEVRAEVSFFCAGGRRIYHRVVQAHAEDDGFRARVEVPVVAVSADVALAITRLPEAVDSRFRELQPVVVDQTVEQPRKKKTNKKKKKTTKKKKRDTQP